MTLKATPRSIPASIDPVAMFPELAKVHADMFKGELRIGRRHTIKVLSLEDASMQYSAARDASGEGGSTFPEGRLTLGGRKYRVSYNGKVWEGSRPWQSGDVPVFSPY